MSDLIKENEIVFVTTTIHTKWLEYQKKIIKKLFPESEHIVISGTDPWPAPWFYWIDKIKKHTAKYFIHIDEDFFITDKEELIKAVQKIKEEEIDLLGVSDGYHNWRRNNPIALNSFLMIGKTSILKNWSDNKKGYSFKDWYREGFNYKFEIQGEDTSYFGSSCEPYYCFFWALKEAGCVFDYLYPFFDDRFKSTNPRLEKNSKDIGIHMWYSRDWDKSFNVHGIANIDRYLLVEKYLKEQGY